MPPSSDTLAIVIPARNEEGVIGSTIACLRQSMADHDAVIVIDDSSTDGTTRVALQQGAQVCRHPMRPGQLSSKGAALRWWAENSPLDRGQHLGIVVLDADTRVAPDFLARVRERLMQGVAVVQALVVPTGYQSSAIGELAAYSELLEQEVADRLRSALGWPVRLRGTGMAFRPDVLFSIASELRTQVEDVEMSLLLARRCIRVAFLPEAHVFDPKPSSTAAAAQQRARWLRGQLEVCGHYWRTILYLSSRGPGTWSLLQSLLIKPRTLMVAAKTGLLVALWLLVPLATLPWFLLAALLLASLFGDLAYYFLAVTFPQGRNLLWRRTWHVPGYLLWWLSILVLAVRSPRVWHSSRRANVATD